MITILDAIFKIDPNAEVSFHGDDIDTLKWDSSPIAKDVIIAKQAELQADYISTQYQRDRQPEYPPMTDYLDGIVKDDTAQVDKYISDCLAVKAKYPKP